MTLFDVIVLLFIGFAAIGGFLRGIVQETLSLAAWILAAFAVYYLHDLLTAALRNLYNAEPATPILAFALLLLIPYAAMRVIANNAGEASRNSILGPIDRVLGFAFGAAKGALIVVFAFSIVVLGFDRSWSFNGRPAWITTAETYPYVERASRGMVQMIAERRAFLEGRRDVAEEAEAEAETGQE